MRGKIIKAISGFFYIIAEDDRIYSCRARGIFRKDGEKPLVGDDVEMEITDEKDMEGSLTAILERKNRLIRPEAANADQVLIVLSLTRPKPDLTLLDKLLVIMEFQKIPVSICFNKSDLGDDIYTKKLMSMYEKSGYRVFLTSVMEECGMEQIRDYMDGKLTVLAGPSGVGKSSMLNALIGETVMDTQTVSRKTKRGKNTTRHSEIFKIGSDTYLMDTPGFSSLYIPGMTKEKLEELFPEFENYRGKCRFVGCSHITEPDCLVKNAVEAGVISEERYRSYIGFYQELKEKENIYD